MYNIGAIRNAELVPKFYPDWKLMFYIGADVPNSTLNALLHFPYVSMTFMRDPQTDQLVNDYRGMFWRFYPASLSGIDYMISRDCDSRPTLREKAAVDEWMASGTDFHIMRDHPYHTVPMLGGMWGVKGNVIRNIPQLTYDFIKMHLGLNDQEFLRGVIFPYIWSRQLSATIHQPSFLGKRGVFFSGLPWKNFPTNREGLSFVGEIIDENEKPNEEHRRILERVLTPDQKIK